MNLVPMVPWVLAATGCAALATALLFFGFGRLARARLDLRAPLWLAAAMALQTGIGLLHPTWNTRIVDRFLTDQPPVPGGLGAFVTVVSATGALLQTLALLVLFAVLVAEVVAATRSWVDWGDGRFVSALEAAWRRRTGLCAGALLAVAIGALIPALALALL